MRGLKGKTAIVTGAGSGIGRAIAARLGAEGVTVGVFDINPGGASETVKAIEAAGGSAVGVTCDITDYAAVTSAVASFEVPCRAWYRHPRQQRRLGHADALPEDRRGVLEEGHRDQLVRPAAHDTRCRQGMTARKSGRIVNIASDAGRVGSSGEVVYSGCKGATIAFAKALAREVARSNVTINTVCPGPTDTPAMDAFVGTGEAGQKIRDAMVRGVPLGRIGQPDDYPGLVAFLASDDAAFMTGQTISVSGGLSMHG